MLQNQEGQRVPAVTFKTRQGEQWVDVKTADLFAGKKVVLFSLPGAYTPTCSTTHLPRFNELAGTFKANGIDDVICLSVNDAFVMNEWRKAQEAENLTLIPDGSGKFAEGMGLLVDMSDVGFGQRSWRYSMLVNDGTVEQLNVEAPGEYRASSAETMLDQLATA